MRLRTEAELRAPDIAQGSFKEYRGLCVAVLTAGIKRLVV